MSYRLRSSKRQGKKWTVTTPSGKQIHFGQRGASDYTKHKDVDRKNRYLARHAGTMPHAKTSRRENWTKSGIDTPGFWSRWLLWNKPTIEGSVRDIENTFGVNIQM
jgi:hypothetical protein